METSPTVTDEIFVAFLKCRYKAYLKLSGTPGEKSDYERSQADRAAAYRNAAWRVLLQKHEGAAVVEGPPSLPETLQSRPDFIKDALASHSGESCRLDALERDGGTASSVAYRPALFVRREKITADDRLLLAFAASILTRVQGAGPRSGKIIHGNDFEASRVELTVLSESVAEKTAQLRELAQAPNPPPLLLNRHCPECEFCSRCRAAAVEKDDLSLLRGLSLKEIAALHGRGLFTVTQYSYAFRPTRMKKVSEKGSKHDRSLQALAIRERTVYVAQRPELRDAKVRFFLDVEGLPDEGWHYLIGLTVCEDGSRRHLSFWADSRTNEGTMWAAFLQVVARFEDFVLFHYGSYEAKFLEQMEARHGGDAELLGRLRSRSVNVLSAIYSRVYFPVHANDLKSIAGCLGFQWSVVGASGLQSIVWHHAWEDSNDEAIKQVLFKYNQEDCSALERVVQLLWSLEDPQQQTDDSGPRIATVEAVRGNYCHRLGNPQFALPELGRITKCAYFDYQRDRVLCRTSPAVKTIARSKKVRKQRAWKVNREVLCGTPTACTHCGSAALDRHSRYSRLIIDLKPHQGGIKRWVTRYKVNRYRCRKCWGTLVPEDYRVLTSRKYGWGVYAWVVYCSIALRHTNEAMSESCDDLFGIHLSSGSLSKLRREAVEHYRPTYDKLITLLRKAALVHADETRVTIQGSSSDGYVWVFADAQTALYVYAPTRDGSTARETLAGFKGVLVSDFYAAYDSFECPQQKCLIHLIRDFNDDLLQHPFDEELKHQAARFTALLQAVVETIDRFGLKKYHLHKHKKDVEKFYAVEEKVAYESERAGHYQHRLLKYRDKLFTFLDHDGVPWNNNNAENAVKKFVSRRKMLGMPFTESGIREYLLLLSICQTLRYRNASFWKFLLSGETDI